MSIIETIKKEYFSLGKYERIFFPLVLLIIIAVSVMTKDNKIALISSICGISYTLLAGKGKIYCYFIGIIGTFCYSYLAFTNSFYGNFMLYFFYYLPMEIIGIFKWKKHLKKNSADVVKTRLNNTERVIYSVITVIATMAFSAILVVLNDKNPYIDSFVTVLSITGMLLTVKRCIEQWYIWIIVNALTLVMWFNAYINGSNSLVLVFMWLTYLVLAFYFLKEWKKELIISAEQ